MSIRVITAGTMSCLMFVWGAAHGAICEDMAVRVAGSGRAMGQLIDSGCFREAEQLGLKLVASAANDKDRGWRYNELGIAHEKLGLHQQAREDYARALNLLGNDPDALTLKVNLAALYYRMGEFQSSRAAYQEVVSALERPGANNPELQSAALGGLGLVMQTLGDYAAAKQYLQRALQLDIRLFSNEHSIVALDLSNLGDAHRSLGEYDQALPIYERALAVRRRILSANHPDIANSLNKLGYVHEIFGQTGKALALYREALLIREKSLPAGHPHIAVAMFSVAEALRHLGRNEEAMASYMRALELSEKALPSKHPDIGRTLHYLGQLQFLLGHVEQALASLQRAADIRSESLGPFHGLTAESMGVLGSYLAISTDVVKQAEGEKLMNRAFSIALPSGELGVIVETSAVLAKFYSTRAHRDLAIFYGKQSVNAMQRIRSQSHSLDKELQKSLLSKNEEIYKQLSGLLMDAGRIAEAQQVLAMLKEDEYFDFVQRNNQEGGLEQRASYNGVEAPWVARFQEIGGKLAQLGKEVSELHKKGEKLPLSPEEQSRLTALEKDLEVAGQAFETAMNGMLASLKEDAVRDEAIRKIDEGGSRQELLGNLGQNTVLLQYLPLEDKLSIIVTTPTVRIARFASITEKTLNQKITTYRELLQNPRRDPSALAQELYGYLVKPVEVDLRQAGAQQIMLSLNGALRYLPFAALNDGQHYLLETYALSLYNEAAADKLDKANAQGWKVWGLGVTKAHENFSALSSVQGELSGIVGQSGISGETRLDEQFTEQALKDGVGQRFPVLHIASHFKFTPGTMSDSYLLLGDGGHLTLQDVKAKLDLKGVDLITLSACETAFGGGRDANGREVEGMGAIMQKKGAKSVMATLWPVADNSTAQLMQTFYRLRDKQHLNKTQALRQAQLALLNGGKTSAAATKPDERGAKRVPAAGQGAVAGVLPFRANPDAPFAHPYFWAPFILMGNWL